ncbi:hypothetical protein ACSV5S_04700 [Agrobacterium deltaense]|uniref:acetoacetate--CoA ligase family protein n=1 Tax=Agrobacterium TaxID=357 RepID=UPI001177527A|nr:acetoacetate--CoA ligase family protein [Agrobacterium sp. YIC 4121]MBS0259531.1 hypothetical protein [Pseudomonadota bacterium]
MRLSSNFLYLFFVIVFFLQGCTATGLREFELYRQAYEAQFAEANALLVDIAKAERKAWFDINGKDKNFAPDDAAYYVESVEPPLTASLRRSLQALNDYNAALVALGKGENAAAAVDRVTGFALNIKSASAAIGAIDGKTAPPVVAQAALTLSPGLAQAKIAAEALLAAAGREEFRRRLVANGKHMDAFLVALRDATPSMHLLLNAGQNRYSTDGGSAATRNAAFESNRLRLAGWVLLIDQSRVALARALAAASAPAGVSISSLNDASIELRVLAEKIRSERLR